MPALKRNNNNIHIGEGPLADPHFIGNARNRINGENIVIQESDELMRPMSANIATDVPDDVIIDNATGNSYGIYYGGNTVIKYGEDGTNDVVHVSNGSNLQTIGLFRDESGLGGDGLFIIVVRYTSTGCLVLYKNEDTIGYQGEYENWLELSIDFTGVTTKYTPDDSDVLLEGNGNRGYQFRTDADSTAQNGGFERFYNPRHNTDDMTQAHWDESTQLTSNQIVSNLTSGDHFLESAEGHEGFWITQITSCITDSADNRHQLYFQVSEPGEYTPSAIPWTHCVVFKTQLDISGGLLSISDTSPIEPVFAPVFYTACGANVDVAQPISIPHKTGQHLENLHDLYVNEFSEIDGFTPSIYFGEQSGYGSTSDTTYKSWCVEFMVLTPFGPIEKMQDWLFSDRYHFEGHGPRAMMHQPFIHRWAFVVDREVQFFGEGINAYSNIITTSRQKLLNVTFSDEYVQGEAVSAEQISGWQPNDHESTAFQEDDLHNSSHDYSLLGYTDDALNPWLSPLLSEETPYSSSENVGLKTRDMFKDRFLNNLFVDTYQSNGWENGVNYPRKSIRISSDPEVSNGPHSAYVSFSPNAGSAMIYTDAAITWGIKQFSINPQPWCTISTDGVKILGGDALTVETVPSSFFTDTDSAPFAKADIGRASINTVGQLDTFNFYNDIDLIVHNRIDSSILTKHAIVENIHDSNYGIPSSYEADYSDLADDSNQLNDRKTSIAECGSSFTWPTNYFQIIVRGSFYKIADGATETNESVDANHWGLGGATFFWDSFMSHPYGLSNSNGGTPYGGTMYSSHINWNNAYAEERVIADAKRVLYPIFEASSTFLTATTSSPAIHRLTAPAYSDTSSPYTNDENNYFSLDLIDGNTDGPLRMFFKDTLDNDTIYYGLLKASYGMDNVDIGEYSNVLYYLQDDDFTSTDDVNAINDNLVIGIESEASTGTTEANFVGSYTLEYAASYLYDNFQEGPLSTILHTRAVTDDNRDYWELTVTFIESSLPKRVTHINLYRKYVKTDGTGDVLYKFIHTQPIFPLLDLTVTGNDNEYSYIFQDYNRPAASYDAIVGISEVLKSHGLRYGVSAASDSYLFVSDASIIFDPSSDYSNYIFRSMPNGRFSQFNWAVDYVRLEDKPNSLTTFNGRLYAFTESKLFIINQSTLEVENTLQGVGCIGPEALISTEYGLCFADHNNIYLMRDQGAEIISSTIAKKTSFDSPTGIDISLPQGGWQDYDKSNIHVSFDMKRKSFLIFFSINAFDGNYAWSYNIIHNRWDLLESPVSVQGTFIKEDGELILGGVTLNTASYDAKFFNFLGGTGLKNWSWFSKLINLGASTQDKKFHSFKISSNLDPVSTGSYNDNNSTIIFSDRDNKVSNSTWTAEQNGNNNDWTTAVELASGQDRKFKNIRLALLQYSGDIMVDSIGLVYTPRRVK